MLRRLARLLGSLLVVAIFAGAMWALYRELRHYHYRDIREGLAAIPAWRLILAIGLTGLNYVILMFYDLLAVRAVGHPLPFRKVAFASFVGYVASHNFGALLGGSSVRYRIYSTWGLSTVEIVKLLTALATTFWAGFFAVAGVVFLVEPVSVPAEAKLPFLTLRPLGGLFLAIAVAYLLVIALRRRPLRFRNWQLNLPTFRMGLYQVAVVAADFLVAAAAFYVLLPPSLGASYPYVLSVYLLAVVGVVSTHVPGGLGVFELLVLLMLAPSDPRPLVSSLLVFRAVYYLLPLLIAAAMLGASEAAAHEHHLRRFLRPIRRLLPVMVPRLLSLLVFLAGAILLISGAVPAEGERLGWLRPFLPLPVLEISHFLGSILGVALLLLARALQRRLDVAWVLTAALLAGGILVSLLRGLDYVEAGILLLMLVLLLGARPFFHRRGSLLEQSFSPGWTAAAVGVVLCSIWIGLFAHRHLEYAEDVWWRFSYRGDAPRFLRASVGVVVFLLAASAARLLRPAAPRPSLPGPKEKEAAARIAAASPATYAYLAIAGDKEILFDDDRSAFLMYGIAGRSWVAMGDPVGRPEAREELIWRFRELCDRYDAWTVFYLVGRETLPLYLDVGLSLLKLGEEARVALPRFSLEGEARKPLRQAENRCRRAGCSFGFIPVVEVPEHLPELQQVSEAWLATKSTAEKRFSVGRFDPDYLRRFPAAVVRQEGRPIAFANVWLGGDREELSVDLMRYLPDAPDGVMDYLFTELMLWGSREGYRWFNLGMAPLAGLDRRALAPLWTRIGSLIFRHSEHFYNFQGLRQYKAKFRPHWQPKYLASPGGLVLPRILTEIAMLISGGVRGMVSK